MCLTPGATPCSDDGLPNNRGRKPSVFATIGPQPCGAPRASCLATPRLRAASRSPKGADDGHSYSRLTTREEATRIYNLPRINDPELTPQIIGAGR